MNDDHRVTKKPQIFGLIGENSVTGLEMLQQVYRDNTMSRTRVFEWY